MSGGKLHIHHVVAFDAPGANHYRGGNHVEDKLCGRAGFHPGAAGNEFRPYHGNDGDIGLLCHKRVIVAGNTGRRIPISFAFFIAPAT